MQVVCEDIQVSSEQSFLVLQFVSCGFEGESGCDAVPGEDHVVVLPVHGGLHGPGLVRHHAGGHEVGSR